MLRKERHTSPPTIGHSSYHSKLYKYLKNRCLRFFNCICLLEDSASSQLRINCLVVYQSDVRYVKNVNHITFDSVIPYSFKSKFRSCKSNKTLPFFRFSLEKCLRKHYHSKQFIYYRSHQSPL